MKRLLATLALATVALAAAACSSTSAAAGTAAPAAPADPNAPAITANNLKFAESDRRGPGRQAVPAHLHQPGERAAQRLDLHRRSASHEPVPAARSSAARPKVYDVPALAAGSYFFRCDVHPDMQGTITASSGPSPAPRPCSGPGPLRRTGADSCPGPPAGRHGQARGQPPLRSTAAPCSRSATSPSATAPSRALDGASFTARRGRLVGFLGPNGAGKTTTMRCIFGLATPDAGDGPLGRRPDRRRRPGCGSGTCPSSAASTRGCASWSSSPTSASTTGCRGATRGTKAGEWLERFGLADRAKSKLEDLSHGNQQRVQLATALVHDPELLVLDEPFCGLDPIGIATMAEVLRERARAGRRRRVLSHQLDLVEEVCEDVVIISRGRVVAEGEIEELQGPAPGRRHLDVEVAGCGGAWLDGDQPPHGPRARRRPRAAARRRDAWTSTGCWPRRAPRARSAGSATSRRKLSELFMEAVNAPQPTAPTASCWRRSREPAARDPPRRDARDPRARPEPRLRPVARVHGRPAGRRVRPPGAAHRPGDPDRASRSSGEAPPGLEESLDWPPRTRSTSDIAADRGPRPRPRPRPRSATARSTPPCPSRATCRRRAT